MHLKAYLETIIFYGIIIPFSIYILYNTFWLLIMAKITVKIHNDQEYIELGNLLKLAGIISTGGYAKLFLQDNEVLVNGEREYRRGRKIHRDDAVTVNKDQIFVC